MAEATKLGGDWPHIGEIAEPIVEELLSGAEALGLQVSESEGGATIIDAGITCPGGLEAGRIIAELCMGGMGAVTLAAGSPFPDWPFQVNVTAATPVLACLASQYAGWSLSHGEGAGAYFAMASGPGRARAAKEDLFGELGYRDRSETAIFVLETDKVPPDALIEQVARDCGLDTEALTFVLTPTTSLAGAVQIVSRVLEVALHKVHTLHFPLERIQDGIARAPLAPPSPDFLTAMGRTNDAVLFGGEAHLFVTGPEAEARQLAEALPSSASKDYGRPFKEIFEASGFDFYKIDGHLFSPARVLVTALETGRTFRAGRLDADLLARSFEN